MLMNQAFRVGYEGEADPPDPVEKDTYTKAEFDSHMAGLRRKHEAKEAALAKTQKDLAVKLENELKVKGLSDAERTDLKKQIADLEGQYLTEKEKLERKANAEKETFTAELTKATSERDKWRSHFQRETVKNQIGRASVANKAYDADQITALLAPMVEFREDSETETVQTVVKFPDIDKDKKPIVMEYTIDEAVKRMREIPKHSNLFEDTMQSGMGGKKNGAPGKAIDIAELAKTNPAEFRRLRKEGKLYT